MQAWALQSGILPPGPPLSVVWPALTHGKGWGFPALATDRKVPEPSRPCIVDAAVKELSEADLEQERVLCVRAQEGDRNALGSLLRTYGPRLYRAVLLPRLGNVALAEEALSTTYIKVVERFDRFQWQNVGVYPWLRVVAMRVALDILRSRKREVLFEPADLEREIDGAELQNKTPDVLERHDMALARQRVERALGRINPRYSQAIRLRVLEENDREVCAVALEVSVSTFDVVLHRAMAALRKALKADGGES